MSYAWPTWVLFKRDFTAPLRGTAFGIGWNIILPLVPISAYVALRAFIAPGTGDGMHPALYVAIGVTVWLLLTDTLLSAMSCANRHRSILSGSRLPILSVLIASWGRGIFDFTLRLLATVATMFWLTDSLPASALLAIPLALCGFLLAAAFGVLTMMLRAMFPDIEQIVQVLLRYLIFLSGVIFPLAKVPFGEWLYILNPFAVIVENVRNLAVLGTVNNDEVLALLIGALSSTVVAMWALHRTQTTLRALS